MSDGSDAFTISGNMVTGRLVDQIMAASWSVWLMVTLQDREAMNIYDGRKL